MAARIEFRPIRGSVKEAVLNADGMEPLTVRVDLADEDSVRAAIEETHARFPGIERESIERRFHSAGQEVQPPPPGLDLDAALPRSLAEDVRTIAAWVQIAPEAVATCVLSHASAAVGNSVRVSAHGREVPLSLHFVTSLPSGSGKSEVRHYLRTCTDTIEREIEERRAAAAVEQAEFEIARDRWRKARSSPSEAARNKSGAEPQPPAASAFGGPRVTYTLSEGTLEGVIATLQDSPRGVLWATDEAAEMLGMLGAYGGAGKGKRELDAARLRKLTEGQPVEAHRARGNAEPMRRLKMPFLALDADVQPGVLAGLFTEEDRVSGLLARLLVHEPPALQGRRQYLDPPPPPSDGLRARLSALLVNLWRLPLVLKDGVASPVRLPLDADADRLHREECQRLEGEYHDAPEVIAGILGHLRGRLLRLAGVLALVRDSQADAVAVEDMRRAVTWGRYFLGHGRRLFGERRGDCEEEDLHAWLSKHAEGATARDLASAGARRFRNLPDVAEEALGRLVLTQRAGVVTGSRGGRRYHALPVAAAAPTGHGSTPEASTAAAASAAEPDSAHAPDPDSADAYAVEERLSIQEADGIHA